MVRFIIVRHGRTTFNKIRRYQGQYDSPLDELGYEQAEIAGQHIAKTYSVDRVYASDLSRTVNTAKAIAAHLDLSVETSPALREIDLGKWAGRMVADVEREEPERIAASRQLPGEFRYENGETFEEVFERADRKLREIAAEHDGETILVVSHGGTIRSLLCRWKGFSMSELNREIKSVPNTGITVADYENGTFTVTLERDNSHLPEDKR